MNFDPSALNNFLLIAAAYGGAFLAALWLSLIIWTYRDIRSRVKDTLVRILAVLLVAVLFLPGVVVYLILRPSQTMEEEYQQMLEEEALLQAIEEVSACPGCGRHTDESWLVCPNCYTKLRKKCHKCGKQMKLSWSLCPYCGTPEPGKRIEDLTFNQAARNLEVEPLDEEENPDLPQDDHLEDESIDRADTMDLDDLSDEDLIRKL
jgi:RNA polymerase subunit RPABC4/transcription elongation factor Spt4